MQKTAKNISLSVAGMMVAVPAGADIASIDYVQRWVQNQSPIPAGSVISGYASGSYGSYLLAGSTVGGPYSGVSISDVLGGLDEVSGSMSRVLIKDNTNNYGWFPGSKIAQGLAFNAASGTPMSLLVSRSNGIAQVDGWFDLSGLGPYVGGYMSNPTAPDYVLGGTSTSGVAEWYPMSNLADKLSFKSANSTGTNGYVLAGTGTGSAGWLSLDVLASKIPGSKITGFETFSGSTDTNIGGVLVQAFSASGTSIKLQYVSDFIKSLYPYQNMLFMPEINTGVASYMSRWGSYIGGYKSGSGYSPAKILGFTGSGSGIEYGAPMWFTTSELVNSIQNNIQVWGNNVRFVSNTLSGSKLWIAGSGSSFGGALFYDAASLGPYFGGWQPRSSGFPGYFLVGSGSTSGSAMWMWADAVFAGNVNLSQTGAAILGIRSGSLGRVSILGSGGLTEQLFKGYSGSGTPGYILGNSNGTTGVAAYSYNVSNLGTVIGSVKGSQVIIEQTTTAEDLQKNTGTIYFPVVQNGTIYGVTLNDFYILMNAQF